MKVPGHHGHAGVVAASPVGRGFPLESVLALLPTVPPVKDQVEILKDALAGIVRMEEEEASNSSWEEDV